MLPRMASFAGFPQDLFTFLAELAVNNDREWFAARKDRFETSVRGPALDFIRAMESRVHGISDQLLVSDKKSGGSLIRIFRDVRFSKDKTPYKTNVGIHFRHAAGKNIHAPGLYVHIENGECFMGVGIWHPDSLSLKRIRDRIVEDPDRWLAVRDHPPFRAVWTLVGESLKRSPRGYDKDHPQIEDLKRKDHIVGADLDIEDLLAEDVVDRLATRFEAAYDYMAFLAETVGHPL